MKRFDIITEIEARGLARGETVELSARGHITPLAQDTPIDNSGRPLSLELKLLISF